MALIVLVWLFLVGFCCLLVMVLAVACVLLSFILVLFCCLAAVLDLFAM